MTASAWPRAVGGDGERDGGAADMELDLGLGFEEPRSEGRGEREQRKARHQGASLSSAKARGQRRRGRGARPWAHRTSTAATGKEDGDFSHNPLPAFSFSVFLLN